MELYGQFVDVVGSFEGWERICFLSLSRHLVLFWSSCVTHLQLCLHLNMVCLLCLSFHKDISLICLGTSTDPNVLNYMCSDYFQIKSYSELLGFLSLWFIVVCGAGHNLVQLTQYSRPEPHTQTCVFSQEGYHNVAQADLKFLILRPGMTVRH